MKARILAIALMALLSACATNPLKDNAKEIATAREAGIPIVIYSRFSRGRMGFVNTSGHPISSVELKIDFCSGNSGVSATGKRIDLGALSFDGSFQDGKAYTVKTPYIINIGPNEKSDVIRTINPQIVYDAKIVDIEVEFADGFPAKKLSDVEAAMLPSVSNVCHSHVSSKAPV